MMDFEDSQSSSSSSSPLQILTPPPDPNTPITDPSKPKKRAGRKVFKETRHPVYRNVRRRNGGKWVCELREPNKKSRLWLGTFPNPETAAVAHDVAALALRGDSATLNFPDSAGSLPRVQSSSHEDIQRAASQAARDFNVCKLEKVFETSLMATSPQRKRAEVTGDHEGAAVGFVDEEAMFNMPVLLDSMAEGMLLTPLAMMKGFNWSHEVDDDGIDLTLWED